MNKLARSLGVMSAAVAFGAGATLLTPAAGAQASIPLRSISGTSDTECGEQIVAPETLADADWFTPSDEVPAEIAAVAGAPSDVGAAALTLPTSDLSTGGSSLYKNADRMPLAELLDDGELLMNFDYTTEGQAPALQIRLHDANLADSEANAAGYNLGFASITWSPAAGDGTWKKADPAGSDEFWVTRKLNNGEDGEIARGKKMSLQKIIELNPNAVVIEYGVQKTKENKAANVAIDNFTFGCQSTNSELEADVEDEPEDKDEENGAGQDSPGGLFDNRFGSLFS